MENIFEKGCVVQLTVCMWRATKKIDKAKIAEMTHNHEWLTATKKLVDPCALKPIQKAGNAARAYLAGVSLPFPINGMVFVPKDLIGGVDERLQEFRDEFMNRVGKFVSQYDSLRASAITYLGELFSELDYPVDVRERFSFVWRFINLDVPNGRFGVLTPEIYEREKQKFLETMEEARELAVQSLREEFSGLVERICDRFTDSETGKPKVFKNATVNSFYEYFETFKQRNIFNDEELAGLVNKAQEVLAGANPDVIRSSVSLRDSIREGMAQIDTSMEELLSRPRRKIIMN